MAISKFVTANTYDLTVFYNWLQAKKAGTFLENMTISLSNATTTGSTLTIASENAAFTFNPKASKEEYTVAILTGEAATHEYHHGATGTSADPGVLLTGALLCANGILIGVYTLYTNGIRGDNYIGITADSSGEVAFFHRDGYINDRTFTGYMGISYKSTAYNATTLTPTYGSQLTSIAPIVPQTSENNITFPHAFAALHTQQSGLGLAAVSIGNNKYITNGYWYIRD